MEADLVKFADEDVCYLTTTGRISGHPHTIEIWFALHSLIMAISADGPSAHSL